MINNIVNKFKKQPRPTLVAAGVTLRNEMNKAFPYRDKASDGWIGDASHQARPSDHNPDSRNWVHAIDIDINFGSQPGRGNGDNAQTLANQLVALAKAGKDGGRLKYVVYKDKIASGSYKNSYWVWRPNTGGTYHGTHVHVSFTGKAEFDGSPFKLPIFGYNPN